MSSENRWLGNYIFQACLDCCSFSVIVITSPIGFGHFILVLNALSGLKTDQFLQTPLKKKKEPFTSVKVLIHLS